MSIHNRSLTQRSKNAFKKIARDLPLKQCADRILVRGLFSALVVLAVIWGLIVLVSYVVGWLDSPVIQPLADERILENVRDNLETHTLLDAVFHPADNHFYISQEDGVIHSYDPVTHLWNTQRPFSTKDPIGSDFKLLRAGCGDAPDSSSLDECPDKHALWALGSDGSLARNDGNDWQIVLDNTQFNDTENNPIQHNDLVTASISDDQKWVLLGTRNNTIGLYDITQHRWLPSNTLSDKHPNGEITRIVWWRGFFWVGTTKGLFRVEVKANSSLVQPVPELTSRVIDLDADPNDGLWVLENRACLEPRGKSDCIWLGKFTHPLEPPEPVIDEQNHYPDLNLGDLTFAQQTDNLLTLAGPAGIYTYDTRLHTWNRLISSHIITVLPLKTGDGFYFAQPSSIGVVRQGRLEDKWKFSTPKDLITKLLYGQNDEVLALTQSGSLYSLRPQLDKFSLIYDQGETTFNPTRFTSAVAISDTVLFTGPDGILLHDTRQRLYEDIAEDELPIWLVGPDVQLVGSGEDLYDLVPNLDQTMNIYALPGSQVATPDYFRSSEVADLQPYVVSGPIQSTWTWNDKGIGVIAGDGSVYHFTVQKDQRVTGAALSIQNRGPLRDVAGFNNSLAAIMDDNLKIYDLDTRTWSNADIQLDRDEYIQELSAGNGRLLLRTSQGRLIDGQDNVLIGGEQAFGITDEQLSDVTDRNQYLYLAGNGRVEQYDMDAREIVEVWKIDDSGDVSLRGIIDSEPLALVNSQAALGETILSLSSGPVTNLSYDPNFIWTVREDGENLYLMGHDRDDATNLEQAHCYFRNPTAGSDVSQVYDARALPNNMLAVLTNAGLKFYNLHGRTWHDVPPHFPKADRIYYLNFSQDKDYLLLVTHQLTDTVDLTFVQTKDIKLPHTCSSTNVQLKVSQRESVRAVSVNESETRVAWIAMNGQVVEWQAGKEKEIIGPETTAPIPTTLRRVFDRQTDGYLLFTTNTNIWRYHLEHHTWTKIELDFPLGRPPIANINIEPRGDDNIITVQTTDNRFFYGTLSTTEFDVNLQPIIKADDIELSGVSADALLDLQVRAEYTGTWTIVLNDRILYLDPETRTWEQSDILPPDDTLSFRRVLNHGLILGKNQTNWWIAQNPGPHPKHFVQFRLTDSDQQTALTSDGNVWRLSETNQLLECAVTNVKGNDQYNCQSEYLPFTLNPNEIIHAFEWQHLILFETAEGLRVFDTQTGKEKTYTADVASFNLITAIYAPTEDQLFLYSDDNDRLLSVDGKGITVYASVFDLLLDKNKDLWARFPSGWKYYGNGEFSSPQTMTHLTAVEEKIRLFAAWNSEITGIAPNGTPYYWNGSVLVSASQPLPQKIVPDNIDWLIRHPFGGWWVLSDGILSHAISERCVNPDKPYPVATAEYWANRRATIEATIIPASTPTSTLTPSPTATPIPTIPCYYVVGEIALPIKSIVEAHSWEKGVELIDQTGQIVRVTNPDPGQYDVNTSTIDAMPAFSLDDQWSDLQSNLYTLPNGEVAYDPIIKLVVDENHQLFAYRFSPHIHKLADTAAFPNNIELPPALDVGWLRWNRDDHSFTVNTGRGKRDFAKQEFIDNGQFLFESINTILAKSEKEFHVANPYGLWVYTQPNLNLSDENITFYPVSLSLPITAAHGHFLSGSDMVRLDQNSVISSSIKNISFNVGDVHFTERIQLPRIEANVTVSNRDVSAFDAEGFIWDVNRQALAYFGSTLLLQSQAGIYPAEQFTGFDAGPRQLALTTGVLQSDPDGNAYLLDPSQNSWYQYDGSTWQANVQNPHTNRILFQDNIWTWTLRNNDLKINLANDPYNFAFITTRDGFAFNFDHLLAATSFQDTLYVATEAFLEIAQPALQISGLQAPRTDPITVDRLETFRFADGSTKLFRYDGGRILRWDASAGQFVSNASRPDPEQERALVVTDRLQFTWDNGQVIKEVLVDNLAGSSTWEKYDFVNQRFPFDFITAIAYFDNRLNVGTVAGLEVYSNTTVTSLRGLNSLYDLRNPPTGVLAPVTDMGIPVSDPNLLIVRAAIMCIERRPGQPFTQCVNPSLLDTKLRSLNHLWRWIATADEEIVGQYYDVNGSLDPNPIDLDNGRLPHDRISDVIICEGQAFTLWNQSWVTVHSDDTLTLQPTLKNYPLDDIRLSRFICVKKDTQLNGVVVPSGTYLESTAHQLWIYDANTWESVTDSQIKQQVFDYVANPPLLEHDRLRLRLSGQDNTTFEFEHFGQDNLWRPLPWHFDRIAETWNVGIDKWQEIIAVNDQTWAATPLGLVTVELPKSSNAYIDTDSVALIREPQIDQAVCPITNLKLQDGTVFIRCSADSQQVYKGDLTVLRAIGVFTPFKGTDPFAEQVLVAEEDTGYWQLRLTGREGNSAGNLEVYLYDEPVQLVNGQFDFDTLNSLALFRDDLIELTTDRSGWFQASRQHISVADLERPSVLKNVTDFIAVGVTHDGDELLLCLATREGDYVRLDANMTSQQTAYCPEYAGTDDFWLYLQDDENLRISALTSIGGRGERHLINGRFTDEIAIGLPISASKDGNLRHWLPTKAGVIEMTSDFHVINLHAGRFDGLEEGQAPAVLYMFDNHTPAYLGYIDGVKLYRLDETRPPLTDLLWFPQSPVEIRAIDNGPSGLLRIRWDDEAGHGWSYVDMSGVLQTDNTFEVEVSKFDKYYFRRALQSAGATMVSKFTQDQVTFTLDKPDPYRVDLPDDFELVEAMVFDDRIIVIGQHELLDISLETALGELAELEELNR